MFTKDQQNMIVQLMNNGLININISYSERLTTNKQALITSPIYRTRELQESVTCKTKINKIHQLILEEPATAALLRLLPRLISPRSFSISLSFVVFRSNKLLPKPPNACPWPPPPPLALLLPPFEGPLL